MYRRTVVRRVAPGKTEITTTGTGYYGCFGPIGCGVLLGIGALVLFVIVNMPR